MNFFRPNALLARPLTTIKASRFGLDQKVPEDEVVAFWNERTVKAPNFSVLKQFSKQQQQQFLVHTSKIVQRGTQTLNTNRVHCLIPRPFEQLERVGYDAQTINRIREVGVEAIRPHLREDSLYHLAILREAIEKFEAELAANAGKVPQGATKSTAHLDTIDPVQKPEGARQHVVSARVAPELPGELTDTPDADIAPKQRAAREAMLSADFSPASVNEFLKLTSRYLELEAANGRPRDLDVDVTRLVEGMEHTDGAVLGRFLAAASQHPAISAKILNAKPIWQGVPVTDLNRLRSAKRLPETSGHLIPPRLSALGTEKGPGSSFQTAAELRSPQAQKVDAHGAPVPEAESIDPAQLRAEYESDRARYQSLVGYGPSYRHNILRFSDQAFALEGGRLARYGLLPTDPSTVPASELPNVLACMAGAARGLDQAKGPEGQALYHALATLKANLGDYSWARNISPDDDYAISSLKTLMRGIDRRKRMEDVWVGGTNGTRAVNLAQARSSQRLSAYFHEEEVRWLEDQISMMPNMGYVQDIMAERKKLRLKNAEREAAGLPPIEEGMGYIISGDAGSGKSTIAEYLVRYDIALGNKIGITARQAHDMGQKYQLRPLADSGVDELGAIHPIVKNGVELFERPGGTGPNGEAVNLPAFDLRYYAQERYGIILNEGADLVDTAEEKLGYGIIRDAEGEQGESGIAKILYDSAKNAYTKEGGGTARRAGRRVEVPRSDPAAFMGVGQYILDRNNAVRVELGRPPIEVWNGVGDAPARYIELADLLALASRVYSKRGDPDFGGNATMKDAVTRAVRRFEDDELSHDAGTMRMTLEHLHGTARPGLTAEYQNAVRQLSMNPHLTGSVVDDLTAHITDLVKQRAAYWDGLTDEIARARFNQGDLPVHEALRMIEGRAGNSLPAFVIKNDLGGDETSIVADLYRVLVAAGLTKAKTFDERHYATLGKGDGGSMASEHQRFFVQKARDHEMLVMRGSVSGGATAMKEGAEDPYIGGVKEVVGKILEGELDTIVTLIGPGKEVEALTRPDIVKQLVDRGQHTTLRGMSSIEDVSRYLEKRLDERGLPLDERSFWASAGDNVAKKLTGEARTPHGAIAQALDELFRQGKSQLGATAVDNFVSKLAKRYNARVEAYAEFLEEDVPALSMDDVHAAIKDLKIVTLPKLSFWEGNIWGPIRNKVHDKLSIGDRLAMQRVRTLERQELREYRRAMLDAYGSLLMLIKNDRAGGEFSDAKLGDVKFDNLDWVLQDALYDFSPLSVDELKALPSQKLRSAIREAIFGEKGLEKTAAEFGLLHNKLGEVYEARVNMGGGGDGGGSKRAIQIGGTHNYQNGQKVKD